MSDKNLSAVLHGKKDLQMKDTDIPEPGHGEVQIRMHAVGICGSDVHLWQDGAIGDDFVVKAPMILGHEGSGTVSAVGDGVSNLKVGDRVAIEPGIPCRMCLLCLAGRYNLCHDVMFCSAPPTDGCLRRYHCHDADLCFKLPDHVTLDEGALLEPLSVAVHACRRGGVTIGSKVLVCGAGPIGLVNLMTAKAMGAEKVCMTVKSKHTSEYRPQMAKHMGADSIVLVNSRDTDELTKVINESLGGAPDITIECSGAESSIRLGLQATKSGGVLVLVGLGHPSVTLPLVSATLREVDIRGVHRYANCYPLALSMVATGKINVQQLVTHRFKLEETLAAYEKWRTRADNVIKIIINCDKE